MSTQWVETRGVFRQQIWTHLFHNILKSLLLQDLQNFKYRSSLTYKLTNYHDILLHHTLIKRGWLVNVKTTKNLQIASHQIWVAHYFSAIYSTYSNPLSPSIGLFMFWRIYGRNYNECRVTQINLNESLFSPINIVLSYNYFIKLVYNERCNQNTPS